MSSPELTFDAPSTLDEALDLLGADSGALLMAGGTSVVMMLKNRLLDCSRLVWLGRIQELKGIRSMADGSLSLGSLATLGQIAASSAFRGKDRGLAEAAASVGNERVRAVATIGGAVLHGDPRQDVPPVLVAMGARVVLRRPGKSREVPLRDFYTGFFETAIDDREILSQVIVPPSRGRAVVYLRYNPASTEDYPTIGVAASVTLSSLGRIKDAAVAIAGVGPTRFQVPDADRVLVGFRPASADVDTVVERAVESCDPTTDRFGTADYKREMAGIWTRRALKACLVRARERR